MNPRGTSIASAAALFVSWASAVAAEAPSARPPQAPVREVRETYFGETVVDPYRWLEDLKDPEVVAWMKAQADHTRTILDRLPGRGPLQARAQALANAGLSVSSLQMAGGRSFYLKILPGEEVGKLYVRDGLEGPERVLVDPREPTTERTHHAIDHFSPSPNGSHVAYGVSAGGSEASVLRIIEVATGRDLGEAIDRTRFASVSWRPGGESFFYRRLQKVGPGDPPAVRNIKSRVYLHRLGVNPEEDAPVLGFGLSSRTEIVERDYPSVEVQPGSRYALGVVRHGLDNDLSVYVAPLASVVGPETPWRKIIDPADGVTDLTVQDDDLYVLTHQDAPRFKVVQTRLSKVNLQQGKAVIPHGETVLMELHSARDGLYVRELDGGLSRLRRVPFAGGAAHHVKLPFEGAIQELVTDRGAPGAVVRLAGWTRPPLYHVYDPKASALRQTSLLPPLDVDFSGVEAVETTVVSFDGTPVPLSIVHRAGRARDGSSPTLLTGYGSYGITLEPAFNPMLLAWIERGGIYAVAHVRGGGERGRDWHEGGRKLTKMNTVRDFIACAEYLVAQKYTSPRRLGAHGASAGGITVGRAITERPDLFAAVISAVGFSNSLRLEMMPGGPPNSAEFGSIQTPEGFKSLFGMDAYHHVKDATAYPAVLLTTGINDPRVLAWQATKMAARLQAASASGKPVLLRIDYDAGHGLGSMRSQRVAEVVDWYAFLLWQFGVPEFQPPSER